MVHRISSVEQEKAADDFLRGHSFGELRRLIDYCLGNESEPPAESLKPYITRDRKILWGYLEVLESMFIIPKEVFPMLVSVPTVADILVKLVTDVDENLASKMFEFEQRISSKQKEVIRLSKVSRKTHSKEDEIAAKERLVAARAELQKLKDKYKRWDGQVGVKQLRARARRIHNETEEGNYQQIRAAELANKRRSEMLQRSVKGRILSRIRSQINSSNVIYAGRLPWKLLPAGQVGADALRMYLRGAHWGERRVDEMRVELLLRQSPDEIWTGQDDFKGYIVFVYKRSGVAVLDCPVVGNAIYAFGEDWRTLSRRSKQELLAHQKHWKGRRFVHRGDWKNRLVYHIRSPSW